MEVVNVITRERLIREFELIDEKAGLMGSSDEPLRKPTGRLLGVKVLDSKILK